MKSKPASGGKLQVVDLARTVSILSVLAYHLYGTPPMAPFFQWFWKPFSGNGVYGVYVFFVVSGFLITRLIDGQAGRLFAPKFKEFYVRRVARILPLLSVHVLIGVWFVHNVTQFTPLFWASILTFSFNWYQAFHPNPVPGLYWGLLWSLAVEEQFYLFYPLGLRKLGGEQRLVFFVVGIIAFGFFWRSAYLLWPGTETIFHYKTSFGAFDQIALGVLLYLASKKYRNYLLGHRTASACLCATGILVTAGTYFFTDTNNQADCIYSPTLVALGAFLFILGGLHLPFFESKYWTALTWPGRFSYGIYLFHALIYYLLFYRLFHGLSTLLVFLLFSVFSTVIMALSYSFFEMPANRFVRRLFAVKA